MLLPLTFIYQYTHQVANMYACKKLENISVTKKGNEESQISFIIKSFNRKKNRRICDADNTINVFFFFFSLFFYLVGTYIYMNTNASKSRYLELLYFFLLHSVKSNWGVKQCTHKRKKKKEIRSYLFFIL